MNANFEKLVEDKASIIEEKLLDEGFNFEDVREFIDEHYQNLKSVEENIIDFREWVGVCICDTCGKPCDESGIYETADAEYECIDCHTACPPEDD
jgi:hypothetical protein